jgi:hypothetical protein
VGLRLKPYRTPILWSRGRFSSHFFCDCGFLQVRLLALFFIRSVVSWVGDRHLLSVCYARSKSCSRNCVGRSAEFDIRLPIDASEEKELSGNFSLFYCLYSHSSTIQCVYFPIYRLVPRPDLSCLCRLKSIK